MRGGGRGGGGGGGGGRPPQQQQQARGAAAAGDGAEIPQASRKLVQGLKGILADRTEAEIYATLLDCAMDPDVAVERLISQGTRAFPAPLVGIRLVRQSALGFGLAPRAYWACVLVRAAP